MNKDNMDQLKREYENIEVPTEIDLAIEKGIKKGKVYKRKRMVKVFGTLAAGLVLAVGIASSIRIISANKSQLIVEDSRSTLPVVGTSKNLEKLLKTYIGQNNGIKNEMAKMIAHLVQESMPETAVLSQNGLDNKSENQCFSK